MMSAETREDMDRAAGRRAAREHKTPFLLFSAETVAQDIYHAPLLGTHCPKGFRPATPAETGLSLDDHGIYGTENEVLFFVDSSGMGSAGEPALTLGELATYLQDVIARCPQLSFGIARTQEGQFQTHIKLFVQREMKQVRGRGRVLQ